MPFSFYIIYIYIYWYTIYAPLYNALWIYFVLRFFIIYYFGGLDLII